MAYGDTSQGELEKEFREPRKSASRLLNRAGFYSTNPTSHEEMSGNFARRALVLRVSTFPPRPPWWHVENKELRLTWRDDTKEHAVCGPRQRCLGTVCRRPSPRTLADQLPHVRQATLRRGIWQHGGGEAWRHDARTQKNRLPAHSTGPASTLRTLHLKKRCPGISFMMSRFWTLQVRSLVTRRALLPDEWHAQQSSRTSLLEM